MNRFTSLIFLTVFTALNIFGQTGEPPSDQIRSHIVLADGDMHWFEIRSDGAYLDDKMRATVRGPEPKFSSLTPLLQQQEYWNVSDDFYKNGSNGLWFVFGASMATGICGIPTYAVAYIDSKGNVRMSGESPPACIGDWPSSIDFEVRISKTCPNGYPVWKLSNFLEFEGCGFTWKDISRPKKRARPK